MEFNEIPWAHDESDYSVGLENSRFKVERSGNTVAITSKYYDMTWAMSAEDTEALVYLLRVALYRPEDVIKELHEGKVPAAWKGA